jgi:hypothetical protein
MRVSMDACERLVHARLGRAVGTLHHQLLLPRSASRPRGQSDRNCTVTHPCPHFLASWWPMHRLYCARLRWHVWLFRRQVSLSWAKVMDACTSSNMRHLIVSAGFSSARQNHRSLTPPVASSILCLAPHRARTHMDDARAQRCECIARFTQAKRMCARQVFCVQPLRSAVLSPLSSPVLLRSSLGRCTPLRKPHRCAQVEG